VTASSIGFVGTGTAFHQDGRGSQSLLIAPMTEGPFLVDLGPTAIWALERFAFDYARVERLFVTHLHGDHTAGWPFLLLNLAFLHERREPLEVYGPAGVRRHLQTLATACYGDLVEPRKLEFEVNYHELEVGEAAGVAAGRGCFDVLPMEHHESSIGYRFHLEDGTVAVTGDTRWCPGLERLARGSDLLVMECTTRRPNELVHLTDEVASALAADPIAGVVAAYDGMVLALSAAEASEPR